MTSRRWMMWTVCIALGLSAVARSDELRVVKVGQSIPEYALKSLSDEMVDNASMRRHASVIVYVAAEQVSSAKVMTEVTEAVAALKTPALELQFVTADGLRNLWISL